MRSVPPRGSGWVFDGDALPCVAATHPLPRGGTDLNDTGLSRRRLLSLLLWRVH